MSAPPPPPPPGRRPPLRSLRWVESFLDSLHRFGFTDSRSVGIYRAFSTFLLGHLLLESATLDLGADLEVDEDIEFFESNDLNQYPRLMSMQSQLERPGYDSEFEAALEDLLNRVELVFD